MCTFKNMKRGRERESSCAASPCFFLCSVLFCSRQLTRFSLSPLLSLRVPAVKSLSNRTAAAVNKQQQHQRAAGTPVTAGSQGDRRHGKDLQMLLRTSKPTHTAVLSVCPFFVLSARRISSSQFILTLRPPVRLIPLLTLRSCCCRLCGCVCAFLCCCLNLLAVNRRLKPERLCLSALSSVSDTFSSFLILLPAPVSPCLCLLSQRMSRPPYSS